MSESTLPPALRRRLGVVFAALALLATALLIRWLRPGQEAVASLFALGGTLTVAAALLRQTLTAIRATGFAATQFYMDQYVVLALGACLATGQYITGGLVGIVLLLGQMLEERTVIGVEYALRRLRELGQVRARRCGPAGEELIDATQLRPGDRVRIRPGDAVPADARIVAGEALINQSNLTGESLPVEAAPGDRVFAGTVNLNGLLEAEVIESGADTVLARVQHILEEAKTTEAPILRMSEDYARHYTPLVLLVAACVFFFTQDINRAIAVLIVSIPCAFVLAGPSALVSAIACASRLGLLVKGARHFEQTRRVDTVVFDKTGTLTEGVLHVEKIWLHADLTEPEALRLAGALEAHSTHPVARAVQRSAGPAAAEVTQFLEAPGLGLAGQVEGRAVRVGRLRWLRDGGGAPAEPAGESARFSLVGLEVDGRHVATFGLADRLRAEAPETLRRLHALGVRRFVLLTGDRLPVAQAIAAQLQLDDFQAECLPEDKLRRIETLKAGGAQVLVVGDGLNDAPALAAGHVGVAMGALGNEVAIHTADIALMGHDLRRLADLVELSHRTVGVINQNLLCGFAFITLAITGSTLGWIPPLAAAFVHEFSAFFVIFNSARLLRFDGLGEEDTAPAPAAQPSPAAT